MGHFDVLVAVQNPPLTSATFRSESIENEIIQVSTQALFTEFPVMILEVTLKFTKLAAFGDFPCMFL